jgi:hypothetical protein
MTRPNQAGRLRKTKKQEVGGANDTTGYDDTMRL